MSEICTNAGSYRDPAGSVQLVGGRVFRTIAPQAVSDFESVEASGFHGRLIAEGRLVPHRRLDANEPAALNFEASIVLKHPRLPFISYPYEWAFPATLRARAEVLETRSVSASGRVLVSYRRRC